MKIGIVILFSVSNFFFYALKCVPEKEKHPPDPAQMSPPAGSLPGITHQAHVGGPSFPWFQILRAHSAFPFVFPFVMFIDCLPHWTGPSWGLPQRWCLWHWIYLSRSLGATMKTLITTQIQHTQSFCRGEDQAPEIHGVPSGTGSPQEYNPIFCSATFLAFVPASASLLMHFLLYTQFTVSVPPGLWDPS